jgi:hypothetical protein
MSVPGIAAPVTAVWPHDLRRAVDHELWATADARRLLSGYDSITVPGYAQ